MRFKRSSKLGIVAAGAVLLALATPGAGADEVEPAERLSGQQSAYRKSRRLRQGGRAGDRRQAVDHAASGGVAVQGAGDQARGADRPGADGRGFDLQPRERGPAVRRRRHPVPGRELPRGEEAVGRDAPRDREEARRARRDGADGGAVGPAGHLRQEGHQLGRGHEGPALAGLQRRHLAHRRARRRAAGDDPGGGAAAGAGDRRRQRVHDLGLDRLRQQGLGDA